ncbi:hypothetical protein ACFVXC_00155 [Streptomyces sp. NPDC058257]|uniref:hypothetical protein n=1 Tax=Streptomyces sp. NPDC058257 TaxID=3346409 RepID=UPI0036EB54F3
MRKTVVGVAVAMVVALLLTGCGSGGNGAKADAGNSTNSPKESAKPTSKWGKPKTYEVTVAVEGKGKPNILYITDTNHSAQVSLPWKKTSDVTLEGAYLKSGTTISVSSQAVLTPSGSFDFPPCSIKVDGETVAEYAGGESAKGCKYHLK